MQFRWLKRGQALSGASAGPNAEVIVVFGGWAVGPEVFQHLTGPQDILFASDYRDLEADLPDLSSYARVSLVAWSFGVASYGHWQQGRADPFGRKVAVNGTLTPVNRATGVPPSAMTRTIETLSQDAYQLFLIRVFNLEQPQSDIDIAARREELQAIERRGDAHDVTFDLVWISCSDKIFPPANQARAWSEDMVRDIQAPHAPFGQFKAWQELMA
ncbi:MAG: biotin synthase [Rhodobacteraceae bacterium]|nr:MAG: biotin synthase [Paracoccaceae bacterium]